MDNDTFMRRVLWAGAACNLGAALVFAFPASSFGRLAGLPLPAPPFYTTIIAFLVLLFGCAYAWLALQSRIDRSLVAFAAIGKTGVFLIVFAFWLLGHASARGVLGAGGDLVFALLFVWWLYQSTATSATQNAPAARNLT